MNLSYLKLIAHHTQKLLEDDYYITMKIYWLKC